MEKNNQNIKKIRSRVNTHIVDILLLLLATLILKFLILLHFVNFTIIFIKIFSCQVFNCDSFFFIRSLGLIIKRFITLIYVRFFAPSSL